MASQGNRTDSVVTNAISQLLLDQNLNKTAWNESLAQAFRGQVGTLLGVNSAKYAAAFGASKKSVLDVVVELKERMDNVGPLLEGDVDFGDVVGELS